MRGKREKLQKRCKTGWHVLELQRPPTASGGRSASSSSRTSGVALTLTLSTNGSEIHSPEFLQACQELHSSIPPADALQMW